MVLSPGRKKLDLGAVNDVIKFDENIHGVPVVIPTTDRKIPDSTPGRYNLQVDISLYGVPVLIPTNDCEIPDSTPGRYNLQIKITSKS